MKKKMRVGKLTSSEPMKVARWLLDNRYFSMESASRSSLVDVGGGLWQFEGNRWVKKRDDWLVNDLRLALEDLNVRVGVDADTGEETYARFASGTGTYDRKVKDVAKCVGGLVRVENVRMPFWRNPVPRDLDARFCVAFPNVILEIGRDGVQSVPMTDRFVTRSTMPVDYDPAAKCPLWMKCLGEWSGGDADFEEVLQRWWGYMLLPYRGHATWMYMYGKVRAGKGLQMRLAKHVLGGFPAFQAVSLEDLGGDYGLDGLQDASVLGISELDDMDTRVGNRAAMEMKRMLGGDDQRINPKYGKTIHDGKCDPAIWVCGNKILRVSNTGEGLSSKMVPLWFKQSFVGKTDLTLEDRLKEQGELSGVLRWAVEGAMKLQQATPENRWPVGEGSQEVLRLFKLYNNPLEQFLDSMFVQDAEGFVRSKRIQSMWTEFCRTNKLKYHVAANQLMIRMQQETSWNVYRLGKRVGQRTYPGMQGLSVKKRDHVDEHI